jgi:hypothetical protein
MSTTEQTTAQTQAENQSSETLESKIDGQTGSVQKSKMNTCLVVAEPVTAPDPSTSATSPVALLAKEDHAPTLRAPLLDATPPDVFQSKIENQNSKMSSTSDLHNLLNSGPYRVKEERALIQCRTVEPASQPSTFNLQPSTSAYECVLSAPPTASARLGQRTRCGKIARLPKLERDLVNKLLHNHVPHSKIVWALAERGITVTQRNISNWRTRGGYKEWCAEQENQLRLAHLQDHLTDYLRKHDAQQLPEVGLQVASTQLTSLLMNPQTAAPLLADPNKLAKVIEALDKCSVRLAELQKDRYETVRRAAIRDTVPNLRREDEKDVESLREIASAKELGKSAYEEDIPHRNNLPPREVMPYREPGPTIGDMLEQMKGLAAKPKQLANAPSNVPQPAVSGNPSVT